jgi:hypothetical protein
MKYFVRFVGHIIQQPGVVMPHEVYQDVISDFEQEDHEPTQEGDKIGLKQFVNVMTYQLLEHGMVVPKFPNKTQDGTKVRYDQRMGVGKHMLAYIDVIVKPLATPKPAIPELAAFGTDSSDPTNIFGESIN